MPTTLLTPVEFGNARPAGASLWRKQILPLGEITYEGRKIAFTKDYLAGLVKAFAEKAYDVVPFQFADRDNKHTNAPEQRRGTVKALELTEDGLDILVETGAAAAEHLSEFPDLGVSARIVEAYDRADGKFFPAAIQHVLATLDPRITGMRPWQAVEAANDGAGGHSEVLDLTAVRYAPQTSAADPAPASDDKPADTTPQPGAKETSMALTKEQEDKLGKLLDLPDDKFDAFLAAATAEPEEGTEGEDAELTDEELQALLADADAGADAPEGDPAGSEPELVTAGAQLSAEAQAAIDLANARAEETSLELARVTRKLATAAYEAERDTLARVHGIPPRITDLARSLLEGEGRVVDLANGKQADAGAIVRKLLTEVGRTVKMLDLSAELGTPLDGGDDTAAKAEAAAESRRELVASYKQQAGL